MKDLYKKSSCNVHALARITLYMDFPKKLSFLMLFSKSQFSHCPLAWMCHSRRLNNKTNALHEE